MAKKDIFWMQFYCKYVNKPFKLNRSYMFEMWHLIAHIETDSCYLHAFVHVINRTAVDAMKTKIIILITGPKNKLTLY